MHSHCLLPDSSRPKTLLILFARGKIHYVSAAIFARSEPTVACHDSDKRAIERLFVENLVQLDALSLFITRQQQTENLTHPIRKR
jgi:hypothetical protein